MGFNIYKNKCFIILIFSIFFWNNICASRSVDSDDNDVEEKSGEIWINNLRHNLNRFDDDNVTNNRQLERVLRPYLQQIAVISQLDNHYPYKYLNLKTEEEGGDDEPVERNDESDWGILYSKPTRWRARIINRTRIQWVGNVGYRNRYSTRNRMSKISNGVGEYYRRKWYPSRNRNRFFHDSFNDQIK